MARRIIICCDGTGNQLNETYSNVVKLYSVIRKLPGQQIAYYDPGVGTLPHDNVVFSWVRKIKTVLALALGIGLEDNVSEAYSFLMQNYEEGDQVFFFGFSRGAYTVRVLAGLIKEMGLLDKNCQNLIPYAWSYYRQCYRKDLREISPLFKAYFSRKVEIHFMGIWDTVSSIGLLTGPKNYPHTRNNDHIIHLRHGIAIDERRRFYRQNLFLHIKDNKNMKQVWFAGVHSDVGGSYPLNQCGLSQITLQWMIREATNCGLVVDQERLREVLPEKDSGDVSAPNALADQHFSLAGGWWIAEWLPKRDRVSKKLRFPLGQRRRVFMGPENEPIKPTLHHTVMQRMAKRKDYKPKSLAGRNQSDFEEEM